MEKFWVVWKGGGISPTIMHESQGAAEKEAERLASLNHGSKFFVLEALKSVKCEVPVEWEELNDPIPF